VIGPYINNKNNVVRFDLLSQECPTMLNRSPVKGLSDPSFPLPNKLFPTLLRCQCHAVDDFVQYTFIGTGKFV
jgi:hypothetical protein